MNVWTLKFSDGDLNFLAIGERRRFMAIWRVRCGCLRVTPISVPSCFKFMTYAEIGELQRCDLRDIASDYERGIPPLHASHAHHPELRQLGRAIDALSSQRRGATKQKKEKEKMQPIRLVSWNMAYRRRPWHELAAMDADVALLQETCRPPADLPSHVEPETGDLWVPWEREHYDRWPMVVKLSDRVEIERFNRVPPFSSVGSREMAVSGIGTVAIARITPSGGQAVSRGFDVRTVDHASEVGEDEVECRDAGHGCPPHHLRPRHVHWSGGPFDTSDTRCRRSEHVLWHRRCSASLAARP